MRRKCSDMAETVRLRVSRESMTMICEYLSLALQERMESMIAENDVHGLLRQQGMVRGMQDAIRMLETLHAGRRGANNAN